MPGIQSPLFVVVYGDSGVGKSVDQMLCAPRSWILCKPGADKPTVQFDFELKAVEVNGLFDIQKVIKAIGKLPENKRPPSLIIDDLTLCSEHTYDQLRPQYSAAHNFSFWDRIKREVRSVADDARAIKLDVFASMHLGHPATVEGTYHKGGPEMPAKSLRKIFPHIADVVYRAEVDRTREPWPLVYNAELSEEWLAKDRTGVLRGVGPGNLREIFHAWGKSFPRLPGLEWQDKVAAKLAEAVLGGEPLGDAWNRMEAALVGRGYHEGHVYWALRDGADRATLAKRKRLLGFFNNRGGDAAAQE